MDSNGKNDFESWRENTALFLVRSLRNDPDTAKRKFLFEQINQHINYQSLTDDKVVVDVRNKNTVIHEETYNQFHFEIGYDSENLLSTLNELNLIIEGKCNIYNDSVTFQIDSGYNSEEFKCDINGVELKDIEGLLKKIFVGIMKATSDISSVDEKLIENCINLIKKTYTVYIQMTEFVFLLLINEIEELLQTNQSYNKCFQVEKTFIMIEKICGGNYEVMIRVVHFLFKKATEIIGEKLVNRFVCYEYNNLFYIINTITALLIDIELHLKMDSNQKLICVKTTKNFSFKNIFLTFKNLDKKCDKYIQLLENHCHLVQVMLLFKKCSISIRNILKYQSVLQSEKRT